MVISGKPVVRERSLDSAFRLCVLQKTPERALWAGSGPRDSARAMAAYGVDLEKTASSARLKPNPYG